MRQKPSGPIAASSPVLSRLLTDEASLPITNGAAWKDARATLLQRWQKVLGPFPPRPPLAVGIISTEELPDHTRLLVRYQSDPVWMNEAYLLLPKGSDGKPLPGKRPGMVVLHATSETNLRDPVGLDGRETVHLALHLVRRGYVCVVPRNFLWSFPGKGLKQAAGAVLAQEPWKTGMAKMTWDAIRATDLLIDRPEVDPHRIGCIGHSLGGKEALYLAAFDQRIAATVSCEGGIGLSFSNWQDPWYLGSQIKQKDFGHDNHEVLALVAPRAFLLIGGKFDGPQSWPYIEANLPLWRMLGTEERLGILCHTFGHNFPAPGPERETVWRWLDHWLIPAEK